MGRIKYKIAKFICEALGVNIIIPIVKTIRITHSPITDLDMSGTVFDENATIDVTKTALTSLILPSTQISGETIIYLNGKEYDTK